MKKSTFFLFSLLLGLTINIVQAQITYTSASFQQAGDIVKLTRATDSTLTVTPASNTAVAWDFSTLVAISTSVDTINAASTGNDYARFPSSDILQPLIAGMGGVSYVDVTATSMVRIGAGLEVLGVSFVNSYADQHITQIAPFSYPSLVSDDYDWNFSSHIDSVPFLRVLLDSLAGSASANADSIRITLDGKEIREVDAFGTCIMSDSTYDVLRQKVLNIITIKIEVHASAFGSSFWVDISNSLSGAMPVALPNNDSTIYYDYLVEGLRQPLVRLQMNPTNLSSIANIQYLQGDTTTIGVQYIADELAVNIFPNPATNLINIQVEKMPVDGYQLYVIDMTGRIVLQNNQINQQNYQLPTTKMLNGHYIMVLRNQKGKVIKRQQIDILK